MVVEMSSTQSQVDKWFEFLPNPFPRTSSSVHYTLPGIVTFNDICIPARESLTRIEIKFDDISFDILSKEEINLLDRLEHNGSKYLSWRSIACEDHLRKSFSRFMYQHKVKNGNTDLIHSLPNFVSEINLGYLRISKIVVILQFQEHQRPPRDSIYTR